MTQHRARVISVGRNSAWIALDGEDSARVADIKRTSGRRTMPAAGDVVYVRLLEDGRALIDRVEERSFQLERRTFGGRSKVMAANVDLLITVIALANPPPRLVLLDQLLAFAEIETIAALIVFTKPDLAAREQVDALVAQYEALGYPVLVLNPKTGHHVPELRAAIAGHHALMAGPSGVGKSSIFRALGGDAVIGDLSKSGLGRQTTSAARLYRMGEGFLIDSPGVAEFGLGKITPNELAQAFRELREPAGHCRFDDCSHTHEPDCGVQAAVAEGRIAPSRYASYQFILAEKT
ncbi:MAG: ribosome small subunit-dependent GTPase A [Candidatus Eremiobacteraeota bacterium]|nr:ribosome small subunit-dependent GTPase A [Candidatus Eremiobacteraeota bacterium]